LKAPKPSVRNRETSVFDLLLTPLFDDTFSKPFRLVHFHTHWLTFLGCFDRSQKERCILAAASVFTHMFLAQIRIIYLNAIRQRLPL
jgi:hypothetical protein